jgi:hypothetical protein
MKKPLKILLFLLISIFGQTGYAHQTSDSYLNIVQSAQQSSISWSIAVRDLEFAVGLDVDADNEVTWSEVLQRQSEIEAYVLSRVTLYSLVGKQKQVCKLDNKELLVDKKSDGFYLVFDLDSPCLTDLAENIFYIDYRLLFDIDNNHRGLLLIHTEDGVTSLIADPVNHTFALHANTVSASAVFFNYVIEGIWHILIGLDHILFLLALLLPSVLIYKNGLWQHRENIRSCFIPILKIVTAFTLAHSITLTLSVLKLMQLPPQLVEIIIAATVLFTCLHTLKPVFQQSLWKLAFVFGLVHGFGFASVLTDLGLEQTALALSLFGFNVGVEIGQLFIVCAFVLLAAAVHRYWWYRVIIFRGGITVTAALSCVWIYERMFNYEILGI